MTALNPESWGQARALFETCLELQPEAREALLSAKAEAQPQMVATVRGMLAADNQTHSPMEWVADLADAMLPAQPQSTDDLQGTPLGVYRITGKLGEGGMSTVYLAERTDGKFEQQVAVKVLRHGMGSQAITARFRQEQHILARLEHPHIARLLEASDLPDGRPCFILEYVRGEPIDRYCDQAALTLSQRIALFRQVCDAVAFAHGNLILHRDIKPSNILVDSHGQVKLLDFGIAKMLDADATSEDLRTRTHVRLLTPEYAAPEQLAGNPLTTACDIYALGVVFFQLLTGTRPKAKGSDATYPTQTLRTKPSDIFAKNRGADNLATVCRQRQTTAPRAHRLLKGDLDTIAAVALHPEPSRRYGSATQLREDLDRYLEGKPISARGDSWRYWLGKFIGRHKLAVVLATLALVSLLVGFSVALIQYDEAIHQRNLARTETRRAERLVDLLTNVFRSSSPGQSKGEDLSAKQVLDRGADAVFKRLEGDLETQVQLTNAMAIVYRNLGEIERANSLLEAILERATAKWGEEHLLVANILRTLGSLRSWQQDYNAAEGFYQRAIQIHQKLEQERELVRDFGEVSTVFLSSQQYDKAEAVLDQAIALHQRLDPPETDRWLSALSNRAVLFYFQKDDQRAGQAYEALLEKQIAHFGEQNRSVATTLHNLASLRHRQYRYEESAKLFEKALAMKEALYGVDSTFSKGTLRNLGKVYLRMRQYPQALAITERAYACYTQFLGAEHPSTMSLQIDLADAYHFAGDPEKARSFYQQGLANLSQKRGPNHGNTQKAKLHFARFLLLEERVEDAAPHAASALAYYQEKSPQSLQTGLAQVLQATLLLLQDPTSKKGQTLFDAGSSLLQGLPQTTDPFFETPNQLRRLLANNR